MECTVATILMILLPVILYRSLLIKDILQTSKDHALRYLSLKQRRQVNFTNSLQQWPSSLSKQQIFSKAG